MGKNVMAANEPRFIHKIATGNKRRKIARRSGMKGRAVRLHRAQIQNASVQSAYLAVNKHDVTRRL